MESIAEVKGLAAWNHLVELAFTIMLEAHFGVGDKNGRAYILHPMRVTGKMHPSNAPGQIVSLLHDVVEDSHITLDSLRERGFPKVVVEALDAISRREGEQYATYLDRVIKDPLARVVKVADLHDNLDVRRRLADVWMMRLGESWWSAEVGWGKRETATIFPDRTAHLPQGCEWVRVDRDQGLRERYERSLRAIEIGGGPGAWGRAGAQKGQGSIRKASWRANQRLKKAKPKP